MMVIHTQDRPVSKINLDDLGRPGAARKVLFAASTGGHLAQLARFSHSWNYSEDSLWVSFDSPQSRSLLKGKRVLYVPYVEPRDYMGAFRVARVISALLKDESFDLAVSTGAALALGVLPAAKFKGIPSYYIESVSRVEGPSLTGRLLHASRLTDLRTQHENWSGGRWLPHPSVLSQFSSRRRGGIPPVNPKIFVTLGTIKPYRFDALVDALLATGLVDQSTVWQLGDTDRTDLPGTVHAQTSAADFEMYATEADVVITHSGVGTILNLLEWGVHPVVVPRRRVRGEHVDDHQTQIASLVERLGVAVVAEAPELSREDVLAACEFENVQIPLDLPHSTAS
jgi:UDP-N-acetylglucosamine--N-acetylmuramyl-(pentapeptide) pyrophosphoryl-undecaprenol N-acetylglucosamine transferase